MQSLRNSKQGRVSICVPTLNTRPYLKERLDSILDQTYKDWDLFLYDGYSDDGTWEYAESVARRNPRINLDQGPRKGPYPAWNECLRRTSGEYVYIATSDDTMAPDFLEKTVAALDAHPECGLAHTPLRIINANGEDVPRSWWPAATVFAQGLEQLDLVAQPHVRYAPFDGLLHLTGRHVFLSVTQLLIRRTLFKKTGEFLPNWGPRGDFNWAMRAGLMTSMIHVPGTWATWRVRPGQLTINQHDSVERDRSTEEMIGDAWTAALPFMPPSFAECTWLEASRRLREYYARQREATSTLDRRLNLASELLKGNRSVHSEFWRIITRQTRWPMRAPRDIRNWIDRQGLGPAITLL